MAGMRGACIRRVDENGFLNSANFRLQKRSSQFFNKRFSVQAIKKVSMQFLASLNPFRPRENLKLEK